MLKQKKIVRISRNNRHAKSSPWILIYKKDAIIVEMRDLKIKHLCIVKQVLWTYVWREIAF